MNYFVILAAGKGNRFISKIPKQYTNYNGKKMIFHSIDKALKSNLFRKVILVINPKDKQYLRNLKNNKIKIISGGKERMDSSLKALNFIKKYKPKKVFIHDAARPDFSIHLLKKINKFNLSDAIVPYLTSDNSAKYKDKTKISNLKRENVYLTQTPQCFKFNTIYKLAKKNKKKITDESSLFLNNNLKVKFIKGEITNKKITYLNDFVNNKISYGIGFDVHRLVPKRKLYLGGLKIQSKIGTLGHSDGDPVLHAITDSILGACKLGDIGEKFSDQKNKFKNIRSTVLLKNIINIIKSKGYLINNIDINIITETPKIKNYKKKMINIISKLCDISINQINIKGKTTEKLGIIGKEKAIACEVITSVIKNA
jgi:2-C-methyl-D-erythritol 4-phosphate cytidylyltransferase/2-C-methyl-D-erythritol 2,4-cyclodiphosphate synthase|tara:strand:+ start:2403 stop:3509 length:1107 start_codon:yes stop_codon:yes gene_type:complete